MAQSIACYPFGTNPHPMTSAASRDRLKLILAAAAGLALGLIAAYHLPPPSAAGERVFSVDTPPVRVPANTRPADLAKVEVVAVPASAIFTVPEDGWITGFAQRVTGVPESALRFSWLYDESVRDPQCPALGQTVFVMSFEKTDGMYFPPGSGYRVQKGDELKVYGGFANFTGEDYEGAALGMDLAFVPASSGRALEDAQPIFLNSKCDSLFVVPPRSGKFEKWLPEPFEIPMDGRLVFLGSHSHKYAEIMTLTLNGKTLWETTPVHLPDGTNLGNPLYKTPYNGVPVKKGDLLDLGVVYDNPTDKPTDAMSSMYIQLIAGPAEYPGAGMHH